MGENIYWYNLPNGDGITVTTYMHPDPREWSEGLIVSVRAKNHNATVVVDRPLDPEQARNLVDHLVEWRSKHQTKYAAEGLKEALAEMPDEGCDEDFDPKPTGLDLIAAERRRQIEEEGWSLEHDQGHANGELAEAAACYASLENRSLHEWPWGSMAWKPSPENRIRELAKAGALIAAELDRLLGVES